MPVNPKFQVIKKCIKLITRRLANICPNTTFEQNWFTYFRPYSNVATTRHQQTERNIIQLQKHYEAKETKPIFSQT